MTDVGEKNTCRAFMEKTDGRRSLERQRHRWESNNKKDCK